MNNYSATVQCHSCEQPCDTVSYSNQMSEVLFIEFCPATMSIARYTPEITILGQDYVLAAMVRNLGNHFSCALNFGQWIIVDDLQDLCSYYNNFDDLCNESLSGWFFAVYKKKGSALLTVGRMFQSNIFENRSHSTTTQNYTVNSGGKKRRNKGENSVSQDKQGNSKKQKTSKINVNSSEIDSNNCSVSPDPKKTQKKKSSNSVPRDSEGNKKRQKKN